MIKPFLKIFTFVFCILQQSIFLFWGKISLTNYCHDRFFCVFPNGGGVIRYIGFKGYIDFDLFAQSEVNIGNIYNIVL